MKWKEWKWLPTGLTGLLLLMAAYLSLRESASIREVWWIPDSIGRWADIHDQARTGVPFALISMVSALTRFWRNERPWTALLLISTRQWALMLLLALSVIALEAFQWLLPERSPDMGDVYWGLAGIVLGFVFGRLLKALAWLGRW